MVKTSHSVRERDAEAMSDPEIPQAAGRIHATAPRTLRAEYFLLAFLVALFVIRGFLPAWRDLSTDFRNYYVAARLYREGSSLLRVYDFTWFQRQKDHQGLPPCIVGFVPDTLLSALPIAPMAQLPPLAAKRIWLIVNLGLLVLGAVLLTQITQLGWRRIMIIIFLAIEPLSTSFLFGQMHLLVFFLLAAAVWSLEHDRPLAAGICVALAAALKLYPALFLIFFLRKKQWRAAAGLAAGLLALAGLSIYLFGWDVHAIYVREILPHIGRGENIDPYATQWNSLTALLHRAFIAEPGLNPHPLINLPALYAFSQPFCQALISVPAVWLLTPGETSQPQSRLEWAAFAAMLMALSTGPTPYHLCILILAVALAVDSLRAEGRGSAAAYAVLVVYSAICFPWPSVGSHLANGWHMLIASPRVYPLLALPFILYAAMYRSSEVQGRQSAYRRERWAFGAAFVVLVTVGIVQAYRHGQDQAANYSQRILTLPDSMLLSEPALGAGGMYLTRMPGVTPGFSTARWQRAQLTPLLLAEDEFHPTSNPDLRDVWIEVAGKVSNIERISAAPGVQNPMATIEVMNGEEPSVSPDEQWLAFIRERRGRGELWLKKLNVTTGSGAESEIVDASYDVWEAAFEPGDRRIIFTGAPNGMPRLFLLEVATRRVTPLPVAGPARYPAASPDGQQLAYSDLEHGTWHLSVANLDSGRSKRLEWGDCNTISPVWERDSKSVIYATDCGRGLEMTALARVKVAPE